MRDSGLLDVDKRDRKAEDNGEGSDNLEYIQVGRFGWKIIVFGIIYI